MSGRTKQPSFGGVAALFGEDDDEAASAPKSKKKQPSFGGVAGLFGDDDGDEVGAVSAPTGKKKKAAPSFGGVAAMFGDDQDEAPPTQIITKPKKPAGRQASFGGVAALFGETNDEEDEGAGPAAPPGGRPHGKQASFGGVASLFGTEEVANVGAKVVNSPPKQQKPSGGNKGGARQQSFGGVASLFGNQTVSGDDEDEPAPASQSKGISDLFSAGAGTKTQTQPQKQQPKKDGLGALPPKKTEKKKQRKGKRDPSVSGIASLFGDDDEDEQPDLKSETKNSGVNEAAIHADLKKQQEVLKQKQTQLSLKLEREQTKSQDLEAKIKQLQDRRDALAKSKQMLAQMTAVEMDRMRSIILSGYTPATNNAKLATVS